MSQYVWWFMQFRRNWSDDQLRFSAARIIAGEYDAFENVYED